MRKFRQIVARTANGVRQTYEYDGRGQLLAVKENGVDVERYAYDKAGNMLRKTVRGKTTTFTFDGANQLGSSTTDGVTTKYAYDAVGRLVREGNKTYRYGYLDKVLSVTEGEQKYTYDYHVDGQLARADYGNGKTEDFGWDGLALIKRGDERFVNEPHIGGGNPVASSKGTKYFNDVLGTTLGAKNGKYGKYTPAALTAFGETIENGGVRSTPTPSTYTSFYTGKPEVAGLGHAFLFRNYRAGLAKWQTADPLGYPDGWNAMAYCGNQVFDSVDFCGAWMTGNHADFFRNSIYYDGRKMKDKYLSLITNADMAVDDDQSATSTYKHAMKRMGQSDADANQLIEDFIQSKITKASEWTDGYISGLYDVETAASAIVTLLGVASHTYQDKLCPVHYENGSPHIWFDNWLIDWRHFPELFRYVTTGYVQSYKSWIEEKFHSVLKGNMDLINEIFE